MPKRTRARKIVTAAQPCFGCGKTGTMKHGVCTNCGTVAKYFGFTTPGHQYDKIFTKPVHPRERRDDQE